jgi:hypothetical protein
MISLLLGLPHYAVVHIIGHKCVCVLYTYNIHQYTYSKSIYIYRHRFTRFTYIKYDYFDDSFLLLSAAIGGCGSAIHPSEVYNFPRAMAESKHRRLGMDQCLATVFWNGSYVVIYIQDYIYICMYHHISKYISYHIGCCMVGCNLNHLGMVSTIWFRLAGSSHFEKASCSATVSSNMVNIGLLMVY